jgi:hypothetical protein
MKILFHLCIAVVLTCLWWWSQILFAALAANDFIMYGTPLVIALPFVMVARYLERRMGL